MYEALFSKLYNEYGWNTFAETFAVQLIQWLSEKQLRIRTALDIGCGTGVLCKALAETGIQVSGIDLSENMLVLARENCPDAEFIAADAVTYRPNRSFDLITATGDVLNHIPNLENVRGLFENAHACLFPEGVFIFDIMNYSGLNDGDSFELGDGNRFEFERPDRNTIMMHISAADENGAASRETVTETIHAPEILKRMLEETGFKNVRCVKQLLPEYEHPEGALYFIAYA